MSSTEPGDADATHLARAVMAAFEAGRFDEAERRFSPRLRAAAPAATVAVSWRDALAGRQIVTRGPITTRTRADGLVTATVPVRTESGGIDILMSMDARGVLHGLRFAPPPDAQWTVPDYVDQRRFAECDVTVGAEADAVPGTLTLPRSRSLLRGRPRAALPAVVLLAGAGPFDRDGTAGPNKPLKDLAWGLASHGVAVLRFDKPTLTRGAEMTERGFTLADEYVPHAVAAVRLLQRQRRVDRGRVYVLGHSAGAKVAPRVALAEPSVAGLVLLAADASPLHEAAVRVARHLAGLSPSPDADAAVARLAKQAESVADPDLDLRTPADHLPFGLPAAYWLDLRAYDPVATAVAAAKPTFLAQGGRDYQVTLDDDFVLWRNGLSGRPDVEFRVYRADDHLFFPGTEPATPSSYYVAQHVDSALISDIADWLLARGSTSSS